ncbi:GNAT family N-acetyltransferase [Aeromonas sp. SG16]|uniref:GNAT family N-acetyltransferase n=1 Tax=Aeromonas sp. SG16 TaxID=2950548 RepID=UPI00210C2D9A|nr:GNAT family N-acetyltransferase [Aeromonas sp. SG16]MCQ4053042.1 GNAT family N-acetyltransferase [Aeromonas sp. SG16]
MQMFPASLVIRAPLPSDATAMAHLFTQLGYAAEADELLPRLLRHDVATRVLLAEQAERVVGVLVWHWLQPLHVAPAWGLISALVVDDGARGGGIGAALLCEAERQAREAGCSQLELSSSIKREDAHRFYLAQAYQERPKRFVKLL